MFRWCCNYEVTIREEDLKTRYSSIVSMTEKYGIIKQTKFQFPVRELLVVPHQNGDLTVSYPFFGPDYFEDNLAKMAKTHSHPQTGEPITFEEPTTSESISAAAYDFEKLAKPKVFNRDGLLAGRIVRTSDGVYANTQITDETKLRKLRDKAKKVMEKIAEGISLVDALKVEKIDLRHVEAEIVKLVKSKPGLSIGAYMGLAMNQFAGKISGKEVSDILKKLVK